VVIFVPTALKPFGSARETMSVKLYPVRILTLLDCGAWQKGAVLPRQFGPLLIFPDEEAYNCWTTYEVTICTNYCHFVELGVQFIPASAPSVLAELRVVPK
jgi:hypothetical protein